MVLYFLLLKVNTSVHNITSYYINLQKDIILANSYEVNLDFLFFFWLFQNIPCKIIVL